MDFPLPTRTVESWRTLAAEAGALPTQDPAWSLAAIEALPGEPAFVMIGEDGCDGIAPLVRRGRTLELAGARELSEPSDLLARSPEALSELVERLVRKHEPLLLKRVPADSPTIAALRIAGGARTWVQAAETAGHPTIALDERWQDPGGGLSSSRRSALRRSRRKAEGFGEIEIELLAPAPEEVGELLDEALDIEVRSWKGNGGTAVAQVPEMERFFRCYTVELARRGALRIDLLRIGGRGVAMQIGARWRDAHWLFKIGYDAAYSPASPGQLLLAESVAAAAGDGLARYELLGTRDTWTDAWTKEVHPCVRVTVLPRSGRGAVAYSAIHWRTAERRLRREARRRKAGIVSVASGHYVAGPDLDHALVEEARYTRAGYLTTVGFWNGTGDSPDKVASEAMASAEALPEGSEVSIKLVPFGGDGERLDELMATCERHGLSLHLDALQPGAADETLAAALRIAESWPGQVGCTLPGRWRRSVEDARLLAASDVRVRIVKGEVAGGGEDEPEMREGFLAIAAALAGGRCFVEVATQDAPLAGEALRTLLEADTRCEQQVLHAMHSSAAIRAAHKLGVPVRIYVPYGTGRLPYSRETLQHHPGRTFSLARDVLPIPTRRPAIWTAYLLPFLDQFPL